MDWIPMIKKALQFIEAELCNPTLSLALVAKQVSVSEVHFTRAFHVLTGLALSEYIRNRRLCVAGHLLQTTEKSVLETALHVGYDSPEAFSKAFKRFHGVNPKNCKAAQLKEFYPLQMNIVLTQERPLSFYVAEKETIYLSGDVDIVPSDDPGATSYLWARCETKGFLKRLAQIPGGENLVGVSTEEGYTIKAKCNQPSADTTLTIPPHQWVVFRCHDHGAHGILRTWNQIYTHWMPRNEYDIAPLPQLEVYYETEDGYACEIWIAVKG